MARPSLRQGGTELLDQHAVLDHAQAVVNLLLALAPSHDLLAAKTAIPTHDDPRLATALANGRDDFLQGGHYAVRRLVFGSA